MLARIVLSAATCVCSFSRVVAEEPPVTAVVFAPHAGSVVVCSQAGARVADWPTLKLERTLKLKMPNPHDAAFSPSGDLLAIGGGTPSEEGVVEVLTWPAGEPQMVLRGHSDSVMSLAWLSESSLASGSLDHEIVLWDITSQRASRTLRGHSRGVSSLCCLGDEGILVSGGVDQSLRVWDLETGKLVRGLPMHIMPVNSMAVRPMRARLPMLASASDDKTVRLWQPTIGRMVRFARLASKPLDVVWLPDGSRIAACCTDGHVYEIDPDTVEVTTGIRAVDGWAYSLAVHPTDGSIVVGGSHGQLRRVRLSRPR